MSQNTFLGLFWPTGFYIACGMRMTASSMFLGLTKFTVNGFVGSLFQMVFWLSLYKNFVRSLLLGWCLKYFGGKFTDSCIPGLKGESLFLSLSFFLSVCKRYFIRILMFFSIANFFG